MIIVMVGVTIWSAADGNRGPALTIAASVGAVSAMMVLAIVTVLLPPARLIQAILSAVWVMIFMPAWDWLGGQFEYPGSLWTALGFGVVMGIFRFALPGRSSRPPS